MRIFLTALLATSALAACNTIPDEPVKTVEIVAQPVDTCTPMSALTRVVIPAKTETYFAITEIENPPYEPIQRTEEMTRTIEAERVIFVDSENREVTDICDTEIDPDGMTEVAGAGS
jgi:hypothetical protein